MSLAQSGAAETPRSGFRPNGLLLAFLPLNVNGKRKKKKKKKRKKK